MAKYSSKNKNKETRTKILCGLILACLPIICVLLRTLPFGYSISDVWIGASEWNDELFYFKQVEGMVSNGIPQGFFGFNESQAQYLSFAAWSPVLLFPWYLLGLIFGWTAMSPIIFNLLLLTLALFLFGLFSDLGYKRTFWAAALFMLFTPFSRYILSTMPDIVVISFLLVALGLAVGYDEGRDGIAKIVWTFVILFFLTLMRPYLIMFMIIPAVQLIRKTKHGYWISPLFMGITLVIYVIINKAFGAPYFTDLFRTEFLKAFITDGLVGGFKNLFGTLYYYGLSCFYMMRDGVTSGLCAGAYFAALCLFILIFLFEFIMDCIKGDKKQRFISFIMFLVNFGMLMAVLLMYKLTEGSKHLITFIAVDIFVLMTTSLYKEAYGILVGIAFAWLFIVKGTSTYDYHVPYTDEIRPAIEALATDLDEAMELSDGVSWDNTVILTFYDTDLETGDQVMVPWQQLYALPSGYGISMCYADYIKENMENLKSRYLVTIPNGEISLLLSECGATEIADNGYVVVYDLASMNN